MRLVWSKRAARELRAIQIYVARDNPKAAGELTEEIRGAATRVARWPQLGQVVAEFGDERVRQTRVRRRYRVVYLKGDDTVQLGSPGFAERRSVLGSGRIVRRFLPGPGRRDRIRRAQHGWTRHPRGFIPGDGRSQHLGLGGAQGRASRRSVLRFAVGAGRSCVESSSQRYAHPSDPSAGLAR